MFWLLLSKLLRPTNFIFQVEFAGGALRCGEYVTIRKVGDASQKVATFDNTSKSFSYY